jgi:hypothetical protein
MPVEYTQVWRDMNSFYVEYIGEPLFGDNMNPYFDVLDDILAKKVEEPLGDLMSEDSDTDKTDTSTDDDDDGLALPSLD